MKLTASGLAELETAAIEELTNATKTKGGQGLASDLKAFIPRCAKLRGQFLMKEAQAKVQTAVGKTI